MEERVGDEKLIIMEEMIDAPPVGNFWLRHWPAKL